MAASKATLSNAGVTEAPSDGTGLIIVISQDPEFGKKLDAIVKELKCANPEFETIQIHSLSADDKGPKKVKQKLDQTFLLFCDEGSFWDLADTLVKADATAPVLVILERYEVAAIDKVFQQGYLHMRGVVKRSIGDPEDVGPITRVIKDEFRRWHTRKSGKRATKKVGWKVQASSDDRRQRRLVSLFLDPVMREFMQQLVFTVKSNESKGMLNLILEPDLPALFQEIENDKGKRKEAEARKRLARPEGAISTYPQPILLEGETGVGKTVIAQWIHRYLSSRDPEHPLPYRRISTVNVGSGVLETELFGVVRGSFTDSVSRPGQLLLARGGVVFLDEIGDLPPELQAKFLVYLDELAFTPSGWPYGWSVFAPVYIIAATNKNLEEAVEAGNFRRDLYYRFPYRLRVPSLRERRGDLRPLIDVVLQDPAINTGNRIEEISLGALTRLEDYRFPGNFRQLESILAQAVFNAMRAGRKVLLEEDLNL